MRFFEKILFISLVYILIWLGLVFKVHCQYPIPKVLSKDSIERIMDAETISKMRQKDIPEEFYPAFWVVFKYMPQASTINYKVERRRIGFTMSAMPRYTWHISKKNRRYRININNYKEKIGNVMMRQIPFNAQVGIISHEIGHLIYYNERSFISLVGNGLGYLLSKKFIRKFEAAADIIAIEHGFGWQLIDFNDFIMNKSQAKPWYLKKKKKIYLQSNELLKLLENYPHLYKI